LEEALDLSSDRILNEWMYLVILWESLHFYCDFDFSNVFKYIISHSSVKVCYFTVHFASRFLKFYEIRSILVSKFMIQINFPIKLKVLICFLSNFTCGMCFGTLYYTATKSSCQIIGNGCIRIVSIIKW
jgi:hypothetical protein